jgi:DNA-binding CsgD family transcriptional regulator
MNNGFSKREKDVFGLLLEGYTVREAGEKLGISHVMVVKLKNRLINKVTKLV